METTAPSSPQGSSWRGSSVYVFTTCVIGITTETFVYGVVIPLLPYILRQFEWVIQDPSKLQLAVSVLLATEAFAGLIITPIVGLALDRYSPRKWPFVFGLLLLMVSLPVFFSTNSLLVLFLARCGQGASGAIIWVVAFDLCFRSAASENLGVSFGTVISSAYAGSMVAPALGGFIFERFGAFGVVGFLECVLLIDLILRLFMIEPAVPATNLKAEDEPQQDTPICDETTPLMVSETISNDTSKPKRNIMFRLVPILNCLEDPALVATIPLTSINSTLVGAFNATIPLHAKEHFGLGATGAGLLLLPLAISRVVAGPIGGRLVDKVGCRKVAILAYFMMASALLLLRFISIGSRTLEIAAFEFLLTVCGIGLALIGPATWVEGMNAVRKYHVAKDRKSVV